MLENSRFACSSAKQGGHQFGANDGHAGAAGKVQHRPSQDWEARGAPTALAACVVGGRALTGGYCRTGQLRIRDCRNEGRQVRGREICHCCVSPSRTYHTPEATHGTGKNAGPYDRVHYAAIQSLPPATARPLSLFLSHIHAPSLNLLGSECPPPIALFPIPM